MTSYTDGGTSVNIGKLHKIFDDPQSRLVAGFLAHRKRYKRPKTAKTGQNFVKLHNEAVLVYPVKI